MGVTGLAGRLTSTVEGEVSFTTRDRALHSMDASNYRRPPGGVVRPRTVEDVVATVEACRDHDATLVTRGGGTGIGGAAIGGDVLLDTSRHLTRVTSIDPERRLARVEPGVVLDDLQAAAARYGLRFGPDPSTHRQCTLGGMIGNNACGSHSVAWGTTADNVEELDVVLADGTRLQLSATTPEQFAERSARGGTEGALYAGLSKLVQSDLATLRLDFSDFSRRVSGYALDRLLPEKDGHVARALVGTEGTCAVVLGATLRLVPVPNVRVLVVLGYPDDVAAAEAAAGLLPLEPLTVEGMNSGIVQIARNQGARPPDLPAGEAWLMVEVGGQDRDEALERARQIAATGNGTVVEEPTEQRAMWRVREEGAGLATRLPGGAEAWPGWEDSAVPPQRLGAYLSDLRGIMARHGLTGLPYGHFGEGCIHLRVDFDFDSELGRARYRSFIEEAADCVAGHGGSMSGEHGDGQARSELLPRMYSPRAMELFRDFKTLWDPAARLNPGLIVDPRPMDADLRFRSLPTVDPAVTFAYTEDGGSFRRAVRRCVGVGKCRSHEGGVMCPSYRATRDEKDSTRGRARMLFEMLSGDVVKDGWRSDEVRDALDLCLSCKGCKHDCPVDVDMAQYKAEFLHHHYQGRLRPASHYSMGFLPLWARGAAMAPKAAGRMASLPLAKRLAGVAPQRSVPQFAAEPFTRWFRRRTPRTGGPEVLLWPDTFTNFLTPHVGQAAVEVLEDAGFSVRIPRGPVCCGLTWVSTGQLGIARRVLRHSLRRLRRYGDIPVVGLEPSCTAALRDDLPALLDEPNANALAGRVRTFAEFLDAEAPPDWEPGRLDAEALSQVHCHQYAVLGHGPDERLLARAGVQNSTLDHGCCGLAGNFGFEAEHYDVSIAVAEQGMAPAVREAPDSTLIVADGFSCRTQLEHTTGRRSLHLAEILNQARR